MAVTIVLLVSYEQKHAIFDKVQKIHTILDLARLTYFEKDAAHVVPTNFMELDYERYKAELHFLLFC
ncbi:hypothetical protein D3Z38_14445 [Clostridiales bacterium]|nr:hypothetical protein [Clostridiales bacterium]